MSGRRAGPARTSPGAQLEGVTVIDAPAWPTERLDELLAAVREPDAPHLVAAVHARGVDARRTVVAAQALIRIAPGRTAGQALRPPAATHHDGYALLALDLEPPWPVTRRALSDVLGDCSISLSAWHPSAAELAQATAEALAASALRPPASPASLSRYDELGARRLLASAEHRHLSAFVARWLGPVLAYDQDHHSALGPTLAAYLANGGALDRTAEELDIHRSTLKYRLRRIGQISDLDTADPEVRFNLQVAIRAATVLEQLGVVHLGPI